MRNPPSVTSGLKQIYRNRFGLGISPWGQWLEPVLALAVLSLSLSACQDGSISKSEAKSLIEAHLSDEYGLVVPEAVFMDFERIRDPDQLQANLVGPRLALDLGLVTGIRTTQNGYRENLSEVKKNADALSRYDFAITAKAKTIPHWAGNGALWFVTARNEIVDVLQITPTAAGDQEVLFAFVEKYTPLGLEAVSSAERRGEWKWTEDGTKFRGKATLRYDEFLKKFVLRNLLRSDWQNETWRPATWAEHGDQEKLIIRVGALSGS